MASMQSHPFNVIVILNKTFAKVSNIQYQAMYDSVEYMSISGHVTPLGGALRNRGGGGGRGGVDKVVDKVALYYSQSIF